VCGDWPVTAGDGGGLEELKALLGGE